MHTFLTTLHVLAAVFLIGPLAVAPMTGLRAIRHQDVATVRGSARQTTLYGLLSLVVFGLGLAVVPTEHRHYSFGSAWITISMTLYIIALLITLLVVAPSLMRAAKLLATGAVDEEQPPPPDSFTTGDTPTGTPVAPLTPDPGAAPPEGTAGTTEGAAPTDTATTAPAPSHLVADVRHKLDSARGRVAITSGIVNLLLVVIVILMVAKPFD